MDGRRVTTMQITKFGHSCLLVNDGEARILVDPGTFSAGFESLTGLTAILITHQHPDHLDPERLPAVVTANPQARVYADPGSVPQLASIGIDATTAEPGDRFDAGTAVEVFGRAHAPNHPPHPLVSHACYPNGCRRL